MNLSLYTFEDAEGRTWDFSTQNFCEAREYARQYKLKIIENIYEWSDSEPVEGEDYTEKPKKRRRPRRQK